MWAASRVRPPGENSSCQVYPVIGFPLTSHDLRLLVESLSSRRFVITDVRLPRRSGSTTAFLARSLSTRDFKTGTANGSELFSLITCLHTTTFTLLSTFSPLGMISMKIWETPLSWHTKCSLSVAVRVSKTHVLKLPIMLSKTRSATQTTIFCLYFLTGILER